MKSNTHPKWYSKAQVVCICGNMFTVGSTKQELRVEICNKCHPLFTGKLRFSTTKGKVDRFQEKREKAKVYKKTIIAKKAKIKKQQKARNTGPKTLKEMLLGLQ